MKNQTATPRQAFLTTPGLAGAGVPRQIAARGGRRFPQGNRRPPGPANTGVTNLRLLRPLSPGGATPHDADEYFDRAA